MALANFRSRPVLPLMNSTTGMYIGFIYWNLPFMVLPIFASLDRMDSSLLEASFDLGASHWQTFLKITLPWSVPGLVTGIMAGMFIGGFLAR